MATTTPAGDSTTTTNVHDAAQGNADTGLGADLGQTIKALTESALATNKMLDAMSKSVGPNPSQLFHATTGSVGKDRPYSMLKAIASARGIIPKEQAKYEWHCHEMFRKMYPATSESYNQFGVHGFLAPSCIDYLPEETSEQEGFVSELRQKFYQDKQTQIDPDEVRWVNKALGTTPDSAGGALTGFPTLGEFVDMQRNLECFSRAGASQVPLGPNGQMYYPKLISGATAGFAPENPSSAAVAVSQQTTGSLNLMAKTLVIRVPISNQLLKFSLISAEAMVRQDMARVAALKADASMFDGVGGTSIKGLLTYDTQSGWTSGTDKVVATTATTTGATGNTLNGLDLYKMNGSLPDAIGDNLTWMFRKNYWWNYIAPARAGGSTTSDGPYIHSITRSIEQGVTSNRFLGNNLILSSQVPNTRVKGASGQVLTCVILGFFPDWLIGRAGVVELDANPYGDTAWSQVQTELRLVEYIDAGPRHAASFGVCDQLLTTAFTA